MADDEVKATLIFDRDHAVEVGSTQEEILAALETSTTAHVPLIALKDSKGRPVYANASLIRLVQEPEDTGSHFS
ncbi:MAG TPA: hypothetical protein VHM66_04305 [Solirubrobacterales bacterium]|jgi:hypothetical protein|nr:hypothetical protein [Solirubrobacterales bacterium]